MLHTVIRSTPMQSLIESSYVATDPAGQPLLNRWERGGHRDKPVATASLSGQGRCATRVAAPKVVAPNWPSLLFCLPTSSGNRVAEPNSKRVFETDLGLSRGGLSLGARPSKDASGGPFV